MEKVTNIMNARSVAGRSGISGNAVIDRPGTRRVRGARAVERRASSTAPSAIDRLVLVNSSGEGSPALEKRAQLLASEMHLGGGVIGFGRDDDVSALTKASDLVLVDRKQPVPFIVPYLGRAERRLLRKSPASVLV